MHKINRKPSSTKPMKKDNSDSDSEDDEETSLETSSSSIMEGENEDQSEKSEETSEKVQSSNDSFSSQFALSAEDQCIVQVSEITNNKVHEIVTDKGLKYLVIVPDRLRDKLHVGNWVVIQPTEDGSQHPAEILEANRGMRKTAVKLIPTCIPSMALALIDEQHPDEKIEKAFKIVLVYSKKIKQLKQNEL